MSSPRRAGAEVNILAMLDGQEGKPLSRRVLALPKAGWYRVAGVLACVLLGTLTWLVRDPGSGRELARAAGREAVASLPTPILPGPPAAPDPVLAPPPAPVPPVHEVPEVPAQGATIVNVSPPEPAEAPPAVPPKPAEPPLRMATGHGGVQRQAAPKPALAHAAPTPRPHGAIARNATAQTRHEPPARAKRGTAAKPGAAPAAVDTDVALISAIIQHVNSRGELKEGADCGAKPCSAKMPNKP
jgi:hypothetical protein